MTSGKRLTKEIINERIADRDIELVGNYIKAQAKTTFRCEKGHEWEATPNHVMRGTGCPFCSGTAKLNKETVNERIADRGIQLIGDYVNAKTRTMFRCKEEHEWIAIPYNIMGGKGCPYCAKRPPITIDTVNKRLDDRGIKLVSEYINNSTKTTFQCENGHQWEATPGSVMGGNSCPYCAGNARLTKKFINDKLVSRGISLIGDYVNARSNTTFRCGFGHEWKTSPDHILGGSGCPYCSNKAPLTKEIVNERIADRGIELLDDYISNQTKATFRCGEGHEWKATSVDVIYGTGCPVCAGTLPLNMEIVNERISDRGIELIGEYVNNRTKTTFRCEK